MIEKQNIHFVGIGGIGMSAIAEVLHEKKFKISGSDINDNLITKRLKSKGLKIFNKHQPNNLKNVDIVVHSSAIKKSNIEILEAQRKKIPIYSRAMMLAEVMRLKKSITIAGSHGKTTITSLIACILEDAGIDPTIINGGIINGIDANAKLGNGEWIVAEADESDGSFTMLPSTVGVINNIDFEHVDFYKDIEEVKKAFIKYAKNIPFYGFISINIDNNNVRAILGKLKQKKLLTYGFSKNSDFQALNIKTKRINENFYSIFDIKINLKKMYTLKNIMIPLLGSHNILNAVCAYSISKGLQLSDTSIKKSLKNFKGVRRRFSIIFKNKNNMIIDDYAHHPAEINVTLKALKSITRNKLISVFEPHRYSRVKELKKEFINSFLLSDIIFVLPIYNASEKIDPSITNNKICMLLKKKYTRKVVIPLDGKVNDNKTISDYFANGDNIIFLGAGQSSKKALKFSEFIKSNAK
ncbi:MAG: UDP-N-acetylmuramate--L-alanine ligase [Pelagibacteraceae bacterium TMED65]|nr:UDP-N-acetylmuramate--L-alanine ligase [Rickettsiales bacterium]OUU51055.1 MAG: UDP-N-acetylmuramate--L-alanine ligase [Pelagibacteraceae bacterium TMED65]